MSWRDRLDIVGSFRGVEFVLERDDAELGRRAQLHEYPLRDKPWVEDLGRKARQFTVDCFVIGPDFDRQRDRLIREIEKKGPGTLVHPYYGTMRASLLEGRLRQSTREQGMARFTLTFAESGELQFPEQSTDTATQVQEATDQSLADAIDDFAEVFSVLDQAADFVQEVQDEIDRVLDAIVRVTGAATGPITDLIRAPFNLGSSIVDAVGEISNALNDPLRALNLYKDLFDAGNDSPDVPGGTAAREQQQRNVEAVHWLVRRTAIAEAARSASKATWAAREDAIEARDTILEGIEDHALAVDVDGNPIADTVYTDLVALRAAVVEDIRVRAAKLARVTHYTPRGTVPAVVIAHRLYGDPLRGAEILDRNGVGHPLFVRGGETLEVLTDE